MTKIAARYAADFHTCVPSQDGAFILYSDYEKLMSDYEKLRIEYRIILTRLINVTESKNFFQLQCDMKVFSGE